MGFFLSKVWTKLIGKKDVRMLMVGLDAAGKTTILYQLKMNETVKTIPTIGFNVETLDYKGLNFTVWDVGGQDKIRVLWKHYYQNTDGLIFVVDSNDKDRIDDAAEELKKMLKKHNETPSLTDMEITFIDSILPQQMTEEEIDEKLKELVDGGANHIGKVMGGFKGLNADMKIVKEKADAILS